MSKVFAVVGLDRCGSTLIGHILGSHSKISTCGELIHYVKNRQTGFDPSIKGNPQSYGCVHCGDHTRDERELVCPYWTGKHHFTREYTSHTTCLLLLTKHGPGTISCIEPADIKLTQVGRVPCEPSSLFLNCPRASASNPSSPPDHVKFAKVACILL
jgi:hypothetical protein